MTLDEAIERYEDNAEKEHVDDCLRAESEMKEYGFAECIIDTVKAYFDNAQTIIEADTPKRRKGTPLEENDSGYNCENWIP